MSLYRILLDTTSTLTSYSLLEDLDGSEYRLELNWSRVRACWTLNMYADDGSAVLEGCTLIPYVNLLDGVWNPKRPPGALSLIQVRGEDVLPNVITLGVEQLLYYNAVYE